MRGVSSKNRVLYQNFNLVDFEWSSRIADNLGFFKIELRKSFLGEIISSQLKLACLNDLSVVIGRNILEHEPQNEIFAGLSNLLENLSNEDQIFLKHYIKFEIELLKILGYGIDFSECAATGTTENLHFVSPKSARAVCLEVGEKYRDKLLLLPQFLLNESDQRIDKKDLLNGLKLSRFFIDKFLEKPNKSEDLHQEGQLFNLILKDDFLTRAWQEIRN
ncbi:MAG: recO [Rickettsiaceae bacterium]|nr:recO [Rickettsiaceae bacterium]